LSTLQKKIQEGLQQVSLLPATNIRHENKLTAKMYQALSRGAASRRYPKNQVDTVRTCSLKRKLSAPPPKLKEQARRKGKKILPRGPLTINMHDTFSCYTNIKNTIFHFLSAHFNSYILKKSSASNAERRTSQQ
jgi:hypothetical protein